jgi:peptide deformylase
MIEIVQEGHPVLRQVASEVPIDEIKSPRIQKIIDDMKSALHGEDDGVAIAAPQIGVPLRIFVVSGKVFDEDFKKGKAIEPGKEIPADLVFINPVITKKSKGSKYMTEGCLSVRPIYGKIKRSLRATVEAYDELGIKFTRGGSGLLAEIFQHETDHLDGILFIDNAKDLESIPRESMGEIENA